jgi:hypothetical protein
MLEQEVGYGSDGTCAETKYVQTHLLSLVVLLVRRSDECYRTRDSRDQRRAAPFSSLQIPRHHLGD